MSRMHRGLAVVAVTLGVSAGFADLRPIVNATGVRADTNAERGYISAPDLAERIMAGDRTLRVLDLRSRADYEQLHIASARHASIEDLQGEPLPRDTHIVLYSDAGAIATQAVAWLRMRGYRNVVVLREGLYEWIGRVLEPRLAIDATAAERAEFERAARLSRFFGGVPRSGVLRAEMPAGYWTGTPRVHGQSADAARQAVARIRRRGC